MDVGAGDVAFDTDDPLVGELIVVASLKTAEAAERPRPVAVDGIADEADVGAAGGTPAKPPT